MNVRYQVSLASVGAELRAERDLLVKTITEMGHIPIDLTAAGILDLDPGIIRRHLERSDYLALIVAQAEELAENELGRVQLACNLAADSAVPMLALVIDVQPPDSPAPQEVARFLQRLRMSPIGLVEECRGSSASAVSSLTRLFDRFERPGWISGKALPSSDVATELARLTRENADLRRQLPASSEQEEREISRMDAITRALEGNKILIPLWERASSTWEKPVEMTLFDFFVRFAPELVVETSTSSAAEYIPIGVCEMNPRGVQARWVVPQHDLNLWLTDLMALGLVRPATRKRAAKDKNQYWRLSRTGRRYLAHIRRTALETGGHRHVGLTSEYPVVMDGEL
ncbi:MAG: hypothetical protein JSW71_10730 [Gemmatimonadota bacterium]|nr:MAG: hypothetical protein JSW71_10730 [Gemmatimonadota bacterium]